MVYKHPANPPVGISTLNVTTLTVSHPSQSTTPVEARPGGAKLAWLTRRLALPQNRLPHWASRLCAIVAAGCMVAIALSRLNPTADRLSALGITPCVEALCFRGVIPGQTSWLEAIAAFNGQPSIDGSPYFGRILLLPSMDGYSVESILIDHPLDQPIRLGDIIALNGPPACVEIYRHGDTVVLHYGMLHVLTRFIDKQLSPATPVTLIVLRNFDPNKSPPCYAANLNETNAQYVRRPWQGFASEQRYLGENW